MNQSLTQRSMGFVIRLTLLGVLLILALGTAHPVQTRAAGSTIQELAKLAPSDPAADGFGGSLDISGETAIVGDVGNNGATGAAHIWVWNGTQWTEQAKLVASDASPGDMFGWSVALSGDTALVGAPRTDEHGLNTGSVYVFVRTGSPNAPQWTQQAELTASDPGIWDEFGRAVSVSGDTAIVGVSQKDVGTANDGAAYIFYRTGGQWTEKVKLLSDDPNDSGWYGQSVALTHQYALVGDPYSGTGSAYLYGRDQGGTDNWGLVVKLYARDAAAGDDFGWSVALTDDTALVGAPTDDDGGSDSGSAYVYRRNGALWSHEIKLVSPEPAAWHEFGSAVDLSGDTAVVGAYGDGPSSGDPGPGYDAAYAFSRQGTTWSDRAKLVASDGENGDAFGDAVAVRGETVLVGAPDNDDGSVYLYGLSPEAGPVTVHAHTGAAPGTGQAGWTVRVYDVAAGGGAAAVASGETDAQGDVTFTLDDGQYEYTVEKDGAVSARRGFTVAGSAQTVNHRLSVLTVHVVKRGTTERKLGYTIRIYGTPDGSGPVLAQQDLDAAGEATFVLPDGGFSLTAQKGCYTSDPASGFALAYGEDLVKDAWRAGCVEVVVWVKDNADKPYQGYTVRFYDDANRLLGTRTTNYRGWARIYLEPFARYAYSVSKSDVESARRALGSGDLCGPVDETYRLAQTTIHVGDPDGGSHAAHRVRIYNGGGQLVRTLWTDAGGNVTWPLIEGDYSYDVFRKNVTSPQVGFAVDPPSGGTADDQTLDYTLAKVTLHVQNQWGRALRGRGTGLYVYPGTRAYGSQITGANGDAAYYAVEGQYRYRVWQSGYNSGHLPASGFALARGEVVRYVHVVP